MKEGSPEEQLIYTRISDALVAAMKPTDPLHVVATVLLKHLLAKLIGSFGPDRALEALSEAVNECMEDLKKEKLI